MALDFDYARLREETMTSGQDSAVTVNTRALIDKVLARYSSEYTTLRELIQNAADAKATKVSIRFETLPSTSVPVPQGGDGSALLRHTIKHHTVRRLLVSNNGQPFSPADWARLKSIADGNPDETKIGAFGVGFYSVFADCDEPFVVSGDKTMAFFWKGNQLFTRAGIIPSDQATSDTCFALEYRQPVSSSEGNSASVPDLVSLCQFLSTSLTFVGLEMLELSIDDWKIATFRKKSSPPASIAVPRRLETRTEKGLMQVQNITGQTAQIDASWIDAVGWVRDPVSKTKQERDRGDSALPSKSFKSFLARLTIGSTSTTASTKKPAKEEVPQISDEEDILGTSQACVFVQTVTVDVRTKVPTDFSRELERATKKPPPKSTRVSVLTTSFGESSSIISVEEGKTSRLAKTLFSSVVPQKHGNIFIGFPTNQTTGLLCHISAPSLIPTVERESIDLNARFISTWNYEILKVAGIGCRIAYQTSMDNLKAKFERLRDTPGQDLSSAVTSILPDAIHIFKQFTLAPSTPIEQVGATIYNTFWTCVNDSSIDVISTKGVLPSSQVRLVSESLSFLSHLPVVPEEILTETEDFVSHLFKNGFVSNMTVNDIEKELSSRALSETELVEFLKWCAAKISMGALKQSNIKSLFTATIVVAEDNPESNTKLAPIPLVGITTFLNIARIGPDMPIPPSTLPFKFTKSITHPQMKSFGWEELHILPWMRYIVDASLAGALPKEQNILSSTTFAAEVLNTVSKNWEQLSQEQKNEVSRILKAHPVIPTTQGMKRSTESYLPSVKAFTDLPIITVNHIKPKMLAALGVRTTVELDVVFRQLQAQQGGEKSDASPAWSPGEVIKYFASVMKDLPAEDIQRLRDTAFCHSEQDDAKTLYKVSELYVPKDIFRELGLKTIKLPYPYRQDSQEGRLLAALYLKAYPSVPALVAKMSEAAKKNDKHLYDLSMAYFLGNYYPNSYNAFDMTKFHGMSFLPASQKDFPQLFSPSELYSNPKAQILGFLCLREDLRPHADKFNIAPDPTARSCVQALNARLPKTPEETRTVFAYLASRISESDRSTAAALGDARIVPIFESSEKGERHRLVTYQTPRTVFVGRDREYKDLLQYVDFGEEANSFLLKVGSKHEPSSDELVAIVAKDPGRFLRSLGPERYLDLLRKFADRKGQIEADKTLWQTLKRTPFLLAARDKISGKSTEKPTSEKHLLDDDDAEEKMERVWSLEVASDITIIDDVQYFMLFRDHLKTVPQEDVLEKFYIALGSPFLSSSVKETVRMGAPLRQQDDAYRLQKDILERVRIFLYDIEREDPKKIKHDARWLQDHLRVQLVDHIALQLSLKSSPASLLVKQTALYERSKRSLSVTRNHDPYDVSRQLISVVLNRPKKYEAAAFEQILSEPLRKLGRRGYNVERILKQREYEARVAESERQKQFEEEKARQERVQAAGGMQAGQENAGSGERPHGLPPPYEEEEADSPPQSRHKMPGAFEPTSPDRPETETNTVDTLRNTGRDLFKQFTKRFGIQNPSDPREETSSNVPQDPKRQMGLTKSNIAGAIQRCRPLDGNSLHAPATIKNVEEAKGSYCDGTSAKDLEFVETRGGYSCFISNQFDHSQDPNLLDQLQMAAEKFGPWLRRIADVFGIRSGIHIFYDNHSNTIAFNSSGALFFNAYYFYVIHLKEGATPLDILEYWYLVYCHELAHNLVGEHSASHEFYLQSICVEYRNGFHQLLQELRKQGHAGL